MSGNDPHRPSESLSRYPDELDGSQLVGVDAGGVPVYFDDERNEAFEGIRPEDDYERGEIRGEGLLKNVVRDIEEVTGWEILSEYGRDTVESDE